MGGTGTGDRGNRYFISFGDGGNGTSFVLDDMGDVQFIASLPNAVDKMIFLENTVTFLSFPIEFDPQEFLVQYVLGRASDIDTGVRTIDLVPGIYRLSVVGDGNAVFEVLSPCAINTGNEGNPSPLPVGVNTFLIKCASLVPPDFDEDGLPDENDNCPLVANADQLDQDIDGLGDVCDIDLDGDGVANIDDNCPNFANANQADLDDDGIGDVCDGDVDGDAVADAEDNCPLVPNTDQANSDDDVLGDACDEDDDNDGLLDGEDNCPVTYNPFQLDFDGDGEGDACDGDTDGDNVANDLDLCPSSPLNQLVNPEGCTGAQFIGLTCQRENFVQHGGYVSCVAHAANDAVDEGLLSPKEKARFVREAAKK